MLKTFYKKKQPVKIFFDEKLATRSVAYGNAVAEELIAWRVDFEEKWASRNFLLCKQGDMGGNRVCGGDLTSGLKKYNAQVKRVNSVLCPLWIEDFFLEARADGLAYVNGERAGELGTELKGWAVAAIKNAYYLLVIGKPYGGGQAGLYAYPFSDGRLSKAIAHKNLEATLEASSTLICMGRHAFCVHNGIFAYFHFLPECGEFETVALGGDENRTAIWRKSVNPQIICDGRGRVFWVADGTAYWFPVGYPRYVYKIEGGRGCTVANIQYYGGSLWLYERDRQGRTACYRLEECAQGVFEKKLFNTGVLCNAFCNVRGNTLSYVKITDGGRPRAVQSSHNGTAERIVAEYPLKSANVFVSGGILAENALYIGKERNKTLTVVPDGEE